MNHTKGNWTVKAYVFDGTKAKSYYEIETDNGKCIASCDIDFREAEEAEANAKLISAAPELAAMCFEVLKLWHAKPSNMYKEEPYYLEPIRKALKKAGI